MSDRIRVRNLRVPTRIGVTEQERNREQSVVVDLDVDIDLARASRSDRLTDTLDYASLVAGVAQVVEEEERNLLERLAGDIATFVLGYEGVEAVTIVVAKADPPVDEDVDVIEVQLRRTASE